MILGGFINDDGDSKQNNVKRQKALKVKQQMLHV